MEVSFIVPSYQGLHKLPRILTAIASQELALSKGAWELIIVIDGSSDGSQAWLAKRTFPKIPQLKVLVQENRGRAATRNRGAAEAEGNLLIFFDDDMRPLPHCAQVHVLHHQNHPGSILVGSQLEDPQGLTRDIHHYRAFLSEKWTRDISPENQKSRISDENPYITAANFSLSKALFKQLGKFDDRLRDAEDYDLAIRAVEQAIPIYFDPQAQAWHDEPLSAYYIVKRSRQYVHSQKVLNTLKPEQMAKYPGRAIPRPSFFKRLIYNTMARRIWIKAIDGWNLFRILPQSVRFRVYDVIITGLSTYFPHRRL